MNDRDAAEDLSDYRLNKAKELAEEAKLLFANRRYDGCMKFLAEAEAKRALFLAGTLELPQID